jgi:hypothetical protein
VLHGAGNGMNVTAQLLSRLTACSATDLTLRRRDLTSKRSPYGCPLPLCGLQHCTTALVAHFTLTVQGVATRTAPPELLNWCCTYSVLEANGKATPLQAWTGPEGSRRSRHMKVVRLSSALGTGRLYPQEILLVLISFRG